MSDRRYTGPIIEMHIHAHTRTTDDLRAMKDAGVVTIVEPAFWAGVDKRFPESFFDYFTEILEFEHGRMPYGIRRAAKCGLMHYSFLGINAKEAGNLDIVNAVLEMEDENGNLFQQYLDHPRCLGVGEIGLNRNTGNEIEALRKQLVIARDRAEPAIIHTPHDYSERPEDRFKLAGTRIIVDLIREVYGRRDSYPFIDLDHTTEETIETVLGLPGCLIGFTLYPTKMSIERVIPLMRQYPEHSGRFMVNSSADWDDSDPLALPKAGEVMLENGFTTQQVHQLLYDNPHRFLSQSAKYVRGAGE